MLLVTSVAQPPVRRVGGTACADGPSQARFLAARPCQPLLSYQSVRPAVVLAKITARRRRQ
jgi:hypothetical protein